MQTSLVQLENTWTLWQGRQELSHGASRATLSIHVDYQYSSPPVQRSLHFPETDDVSLKAPGLTQGQYGGHS